MEEEANSGAMEDLLERGKRGGEREGGEKRG